MEQLNETVFEEQVAKAFADLNYEVFIEPGIHKDRDSWKSKFTSWFWEPPDLPEIGPDLLVKAGGKTLVVQAKAFPVWLGPVVQARHYADFFEAPAIICMPMEAFSQVPESIRKLADANDIILSSLEGLQESIATLTDKGLFDDRSVIKQKG